MNMAPGSLLDQLTYSVNKEKKETIRSDNDRQTLTT
jgi:hypothetical protein